MKIALVCPASLPATQFGGILFLCVDMARELAKEGHDITIFTTDLDSANNARTFNKNLPRMETYGGFKINRSHVWFSFQLFYVNPGMYCQIIKDRHDIIHTVGLRSFQSFVASLAAKNRKIPLVISDQGGLTTHPELKSSLFKRMLYKLQNPVIRFIINQADRIVVANEYEKEIFAKFTSDSKITIVRNGISLDELRSASRDFKEKYRIQGRFVLFVGRFSKVKGIDILLRAWSQIKEETDKLNTKLVIMGVDFGFESDMYKMIDELKMKDSVIVIKKPPREEVISAYQWCEFLVLPSRWELSPLTPLEVFAFRKPVISTMTHGIPYTIKDGVNALLIEPENHQQLATSILKLLKNDELRKEYGQAGYEFVRDIGNSKIMVKNILRIYQEIVNAHLIR